MYVVIGGCWGGWRLVLIRQDFQAMSQGVGGQPVAARLDLDDIDLVPTDSVVLIGVEVVPDESDGATLLKQACLWVGRGLS